MDDVLVFYCFEMSLKRVFSAISFVSLCLSVSSSFSLICLSQDMEPRHRPRKFWLRAELRVLGTGMLGAGGVPETGQLSVCS